MKHESFVAMYFICLLFFLFIAQLKDAEYARMKIYLNNTVSISSVSDICELSDQSVLTRHMLLKDSKYIAYTCIHIITLLQFFIEMLQYDWL